MAGAQQMEKVAEGDEIRKDRARSQEDWYTRVRHLEFIRCHRKPMKMLSKGVSPSNKCFKRGREASFSLDISFLDTPLHPSHHPGHSVVISCLPHWPEAP